MTTEPMCYIARCKCGRITFACVDDPEHAKDTAKSVAEVIREGRQVERVTLDVPRKGEWCWDGPKCAARADEAPVKPKTKRQKELSL